MINKKRDRYLHNFLINLAEKLFLLNNFEKAAQLISKIAYYHTKYYYGYLTSIRLEKLLLRIGQANLKDSNFKEKDSNQKKVLHVATEFYSIGGHTRVILDWVKYDSEHSSEILITNQNQNFDLDIPSKITYLKEGANIEKAKQFRHYLTENYFDIIILHQNMDDVIPTLALWDIKTKTDCLVLFYNHANFRFSIGNIVAHKRINFCEGDKIISEKYRIPIEDFLLPFVLGEQRESKPENHEIGTLRKQLKIEGKTIFLTIGSSYKYEPYQDLNFLEEWNHFLKKNTNCALIVIGCDTETFDNYCRNSTQTNNLILLGKIIDPTLYYQLSEYIVDIYPLQTGLGMVQGLIYGLAPILPYSDSPYVMGNELNSLYPIEMRKQLTYTNKESYFNFIENELETEEYKHKSKNLLDEYLINNHLATSWRKKLHKIYESDIINKKINKIEDHPIMSTASDNWLKYNDSLASNYALLILCLKTSRTWNFKLIFFYIQLSIKYKKIVAGKLFLRYLIGQ